MEKISWTKAQKCALECRGKDMIISAAAGSGKTAVLCERILRRITDKDNPADISRMLVVTFTRAAASELREKLAVKLHAASADEPSNRHLRRQITRLGKAKISTIHSFCLDIVRSNFYKLGISPSARVADETEIMLLKNRVMDGCIDYMYSEGGKEFEELCDLFASSRDDRLSEIFISLYNRLMSVPKGIECVRESAEALDSGKLLNLSSTIWGEVLINSQLEILENYRCLYENALAILGENKEAFAAWGGAYSDDLGLIYDLITACKCGKNLSNLTTEFEFATKKVLKAAFKDDQTEYCSELRDEFKKTIKDNKKLISRNAEAVKRSFEKTSSYCQTLYRLLSEFNSLFDCEKKRLGILGYDDLERYCSSLLCGENGTTELAREISARFDEIYIDEYQDVNSIQDAIFSSISAENRFMVGDIKQSIYGFRGACPEIFSHYRDIYSDPENETIGNGTKIFLSENFRSDRCIIDLTNAVCGRILSISKTINYCNQDDLVYTRADKDKNLKSEIVIFSKDKTPEAEYTAQRIRAMIDSGRKPKEIAVLVRSIRNTGDELRKAFEKYRIPADIDAGEDFFSRPEILLILCLLNAIDNPTRDIYLAGALRSPFFDFSLDTLAALRQSSKGANLFSSLAEYTENNDFEPGKRFLSFLEKYRLSEQQSTPAELVWSLINEYMLIPTACREKNADEAQETRRAIMRFYEIARGYSVSSCGGLSGFLRHVSSMTEAGKNGTDSSGMASESVRIMTIHASKGLEFPVCFLYGTGKLLSGRIPDILFDNDLGIAFKISDESGYAKMSTPVLEAVSQKNIDSDTDEEMRILYVALTRAKEQLIITGTVPDSEKLLRNVRNEGKLLSRAQLKRSRSYLWWMMYALSVGSAAKAYELKVDEALLPVQSEKAAIVELVPDRENVERLKALIKQRFDFVYPYEKAASLPAKLSVSKLYPGMFDENPDQAAMLPEKLKCTARIPYFISPSQAESGAERGTATHAFMQFCDFSGICESGAKKELDRLTESGFIAPNTASLVDLQKIENFFKSQLWNQMKNARSIMRERRFLIKLPASNFSEGENSRLLQGEQILIQGVIDCFFESEDGKITLVDYKTDGFPADILHDREAVENILRERHGTQLDYYRLALERILGRRVDKVAIYSFALDDTVFLPVKNFH